RRDDDQRRHERPGDGPPRAGPAPAGDGRGPVRSRPGTGPRRHRAGRAVGGTSGDDGRDWRARGMTEHAGWQGRYLEDFAVGDSYPHAHGRTISEADNTCFTLLTNNPHDVHYNADYASRTE